MYLLCKLSLNHSGFWRAAWQPEHMTPLDRVPPALDQPGARECGPGWGEAGVTGMPYLLCPGWTPLFWPMHLALKPPTQIGQGAGLSQAQ